MIAYEEKATLLGRQCGINQKQNYITRLAAGGQRLSDTGLVELSPDISGTVAMAQLGDTALQHTPDVESDLLSSLVVVSSNLSRYPNMGDQTPELESAQLFCINFSHAGRSKSFSLLPQEFDVLKHDFNMNAAAIKKAAIHSVFFIGYPFGSMPRCCSSLRIIRLIQAASDSSPSCCWACSISSRNSGSSLNWNGGLPRLSFLCVDTLITPDVMCLCVVTHYIHALQIATPRSAGTLPRRLTKPLSEVTTMAELKHTQTRPKYQYLFDALARNDMTAGTIRISIEADSLVKARQKVKKDYVAVFYRGSELVQPLRPEFTWRFLSISERYPTAKPLVIYVNASSEQEARDTMPGVNLIFAARLPYQAFLVLEVRHA